MFYLRRKSDGQYLYYINGDSTSMSSKIKDAIPFNELDTAKCMKSQIEQQRKEGFEIISVVTKITVVPLEEDGETLNEENED